MADDEMYDAQARDWLESVDTPPPRLSVAQIVDTGRERIRRRRMLAAGGTAAIVVGAVAAFPAAARIWPDRTGPDLVAGHPLDCTVTQLALHAGEDQSVRVTATDPTGRYLTGQGTHRGGEDPVTGERIDEPAVTILWQDGDPVYIPALHGTIDAVDVNSHGVVVGYGRPTGHLASREAALDGSYGWVFSEGEMRELPAPPGFSVIGVAGINDAGDVVGSATDLDGVSLEVLWRAVGVDEVLDPPEVLPVPEGKTAHGSDIAEDGTVVGSLATVGDDASGPIAAYIWESDGVGRELPSPPGTTDSSAWAIRGDWVVGTAYVPVPEEGAVPSAPAVPSLRPPAPYEGGPPQRIQLPVRWNLRTGSVELVDPGAQPWRQFDILPRATTDAGDILLNDLAVPLLLRDDQWFTLPFDGLEARPWAMSADGRTIGGEVTLAPRTNSNEPPGVPVVWHC